MVNNINPANSHALTDLQSAALEQAQQISQGQAGKASQADKSSLADRMDISDEALQLANRDKDIFKFVRLLSGQAEDFDSDKVSNFKSLLDNGNISDYLNRLGNDTLASDLLKSPAAAVLV